jgi:hypothetical protein
MATPRPTPVDKYALGRNSFVEMWFLQAGTADSYVGFSICISEGSVSLDTDTIEINSNCQAGWKVKLPGLKSGTASFTGYIASSIEGTPGPGEALEFDSDTARDKHDIMQYLGEPCFFYAYSLQSPSQASGEFGIQSGSSDEVPFALIPQGSSILADEQVNGFFKTGSVTISPDDAVKVSMSVELSGKQTIQGFVAVGSMFPAPV